MSARQRPSAPIVLREDEVARLWDTPVDPQTAALIRALLPDRFVVTARPRRAAAARTGVRR